MNMLGIDTSSWKRDIDLSKVGIDFVYTKATEGDYYIDPSCDSIIQQAVLNGKKWGVYHFATNQITDPVREANFFVDNCLGCVSYGLLILDYENYRWSDGTLANDSSDVGWAKLWLDTVFNRTGVRPLIYMSSSVVGSNDWSSVIAADYGLIVAAYPKDNTPIYNFDMAGISDPSPSWGVVGNVMWQFTSTGQLNGYNGNLDCNVFYGDASTWDAYAKTQAVSPAPTQPSTQPPIQSPEPMPEPGTVVTPTPPTEPVTTPADQVIPVEETLAEIDRKKVLKATLVRALSTFYQAFIGVFAAGIFIGIDRTALVALITAAAAAGVSAIKNSVVKPKEAK